MAAAAETEGRKGLFATKPIDVLVEETHEKDTELRRAVGALDLTALGLGAIIGTGIFVIIGEAITTSGPSIILSFVLAGVTCAFSALAFAELASASEEVKEPKRDLPIAIIGSPAIATLLYIAVAVVASGALPFDKLKGQDAPLAEVLDKAAGLTWGAPVISFGALVAITSVVLTLLYGQSRILFAMSRDGLMPKRVARVHPTRRTPIFIIAVCGVVFATLAAFVPLKDIVELVNIGTLFAFVVVNVGVLILRRTRRDMDRGYRVPLVPVFPIIGIALCVYLMADLPGITWLRFVIWMAIGFVIYFFYGRSHSRLRRGDVVNPDAELPSP